MTPPHTIKDSNVLNRPRTYFSAYTLCHNGTTMYASYVCVCSYKGRLVPRTRYVYFTISGKSDLILTSSTVSVPSSKSSRTLGLTSLTPVEASVFRHEFINIFRWSHETTLHPDDIRIVEAIDEKDIRYEEENGTVFMAKNVMESLRKAMHMSDRRMPVHTNKSYKWRRQA